MSGAVALKNGVQSESDAELLRASVEGSEAAFATLMHRHMHVPFAASRRILGDATEAEDVAQDAIVRLWQQGEDLLSKPLNVPAWLRRVAVNLSIDRLRAGKRLDVRDDLPEMPVAPRQLRSLERADAAGRLQASLDELPDRQRVALTLFHIEEMSQRDVAEAMDITEDALESLLRRARKNLKSALADDWPGLVASFSRTPA